MKPTPIAARTLLAKAGVDLNGLNPVVLEMAYVRIAPVWMRRMWIGPVAAMTLPWAIYVRPDTLEADARILGQLLVHELVHLRQWMEVGTLRYSYRYLFEYVRGRARGMSHHEAYLAIGFEVEARQAENTLGNPFNSFPGGGRQP